MPDITGIFRRVAITAISLCAVALIATAIGVRSAAAADPIRVGLSISLTGPTAPAGKQVMAGLEIWRDDVNAKGGLLGRPVELIYYDDQGNPANAPRDLRQADGHRQSRSADRPLRHAGDRGGAAGHHAGEPHHARYFRPRRQRAVQISALFLDEFARPVDVGLFGMRVRACRRADAEADTGGAGGRRHRVFQKALEGARDNAKKKGFEIVFDRTYPLSTTEFTPIVRAIQASNPDIVFGATFPVDTAGIVSAAKEIQFRPKMIGGAMLGLLITAIKQKLGPDINGYISNEFYIPAPSLQFEGTQVFLQEYQKRAQALGIDPLGYTYPPYAYATGQILAKAVTETRSLDDGKLAAYLSANAFDTIIGPIKFGENWRMDHAAYHLHPIPGDQRP